MAQEILNAHNKYRAELGLPLLVWSQDLANEAQNWADNLTARGAFEHSGAHGVGENLWMGTSGAFSFSQMVDSWGSEKGYFQYGTFPNVSKTGNWQNVGHYTQMIWRNTHEVGCAGTDGPDGIYRFVGRYRAPGNVTGRKPY